MAVLHSNKSKHSFYKYALCILNGIRYWKLREEGSLYHRGSERQSSGNYVKALIGAFPWEVEEHKRLELTFVA